jgi:hypothetical protein
VQNVSDAHHCRKQHEWGVEELVGKHGARYDQIHVETGLQMWLKEMNAQVSLFGL